MLAVKLDLTYTNVHSVNVLAKAQVGWPNTSRPVVAHIALVASRDTGHGCGYCLDIVSYLSIADLPLNELSKLVLQWALLV